jgi:hypothetical protein
MLEASQAFGSVATNAGNFVVVRIATVRASFGMIWGVLVNDGDASRVAAARHAKEDEV